MRATIGPNTVFKKIHSALALGLFVSACLPGSAAGDNDCCLINQGEGVAMKCSEEANWAACKAAGGAIWAPQFDCVNNNDKSCDLKDGAGVLTCTDEAVGFNCTPTLGACCLPDETCESREQASCDAAGGKYHGDGTTCLDFAPDGVCIPAMSEWGLAVLVLLVLAAGTIVLGRARGAPRAA